MQNTEEHAFWLFIAVISIRQTSENGNRLRIRCVNGDSTDRHSIRILFTNYDIITYFFNLAPCSEHFISIRHRILATFNINKKINSDSVYAFKV